MLPDNVDSVVKKLKKTKYLGILQEYLSKLHLCGNENLSESIEIFDTIFDYYGNSDLIKDFDNVDDDDDYDDDADDADGRIKIKEFLSKSFRSYFEIILSKLEDNVQNLDPAVILNTLMRTLTLNYKILYKRRSPPKLGREKFTLNFPNNYFKKILQAYLSCKSKEELKKTFEELLVFDDIRYYTLKNIGVILNNNNPEVDGNSNLEAIFETLMICTHFNVPDKVTSFFKDVFPDANFEFSNILNNYKAVFSSAWLGFLKQPNLTTKTQKRILVFIDTKVLPHLSDPKLLIDFLTDSYEVGGVHSLLALNGLFVLMNQYNLDYPDFYEKLYGLLSPTVFHVKYKTRFFNLLDLFLSSTHLPNYLVAGFIKRMSRIMIFAHVDDAELLLVFIKKLFIQHPSSQTLIHRNSVRLFSFFGKLINKNQKSSSSMVVA